MSKTLLIAEHADGTLRKSTLQAMSLARDLVAKRGGSLSVVVIGHQLGAVAQELASYGAETIYVLDGEPWTRYLSQPWTAALHGLIGAQGFDGVVCSSSTFGKDLLPRVAMSQGWGMVADCVGLVEEGGQVLYKRPMYAGNVVATVRVNTPGVVISVRASEFDAAGSDVCGF
jgi:electron transfer flavoprotein alpha subunit